MRTNRNKPVLPDPDVEACQEVLTRVLASRQLRRSERLRDFLTYVGTRALRDRVEEIRETEIGCHVFGRKEDYDTSQDNIVRVNASDLRRRLEDYFKNEGSGEPITIELARGSYRPRFIARVARAVEPPPAVEAPAAQVLPGVPAPPPPAAAAPAVRASRGWPFYAGFFVLGAVAALGFAFLFRDGGAGGSAATPPVVARFWNQLFQDGRRTGIILADSNLSLYQDLSQTQFTLDQYTKHDYLTRPSQAGGFGNRELRMLMERRYTSLADAQLLGNLMRIVPPGEQNKPAVYFARDYPAADLRSTNVIIVGGKRSNPWAEAFEDQRTFRFSADVRTGVSTIRDLQPAPGAPAEYSQAGQTVDLPESFAVISFLPNDRGWVLLITGTGMDGTLAAGEVITSERWMEEVARRLGTGRGERFPFFELLLYSKRLGGGSIGDIQIRACRARGRP